MASNLIATLSGMGEDTEGALQRFGGNAALYERFLRKFAEDDTYAKAQAAWAAGDWDAMYSALHTLKGVAGNLGLSSLYQPCCQVVDLMRARQYDGAKEAYPALEAAYQALRPVFERAAEEGAQ